MSFNVGHWLRNLHHEIRMHSGCQWIATEHSDWSGTHPRVGYHYIRQQESILVGFTYCPLPVRVGFVGAQTQDSYV